MRYLRPFASMGVPKLLEESASHEGRRDDNQSCGAGSTSGNEPPLAQRISRQQSAGGSTRRPSINGTSEPCRLSTTPR
jgi:hypothetical protein